MIYKLINQSDEVLNIDNEDIYNYVLVKYNMLNGTDAEILTLMKDVTRDPNKLHEISVETQVNIYDILQIIVIELPELVDKRFLTRMRKLYNTKM